MLLRRPAYIALASVVHTLTSRLNSIALSTYVQHASGSVFDRLVVRGAENVDRSTAIMARIRKGVSEDDKTTHPCFIVSRADSKRLSPFQIQVREG